MLIASIVIATLLAVLVALLVACRRAQAQARICAEQLERAERESHAHRQTLAHHVQVDALKDEFISTVSHELRTPLTSIRGALGLLGAGQFGVVDARGQNLIRIASSNTDRLVRLINDILDLERMDAGRSILELRPCNLDDIISQAVDTMLPIAGAAGIEIDVIPASETTFFLGDPDRVLQILCNLLSNAIKFSPQDATVRLVTTATPTEITLCVEDHGRGVPADKLETIFDRFQQVDPSDARQKGGTGLGLAICRRIAAQHGGSITAARNDSEDPSAHGCTFIFKLPRLSSDALNDALNDPVKDQHSTAANSIPPATPATNSHSHTTPPGIEDIPEIGLAL